MNIVPARIQAARLAHEVFVRIEEERNITNTSARLAHDGSVRVDEHINSVHTRRIT